MAANSQQCKTRFKKKLYLKLEMWPVNALRLEWCYDTGNDKNITIMKVIYAACLMRLVTIYFNL